MTPKLQCTDQDWHMLALEIDKARDGSHTIRVDKGALDRLMKDHSNLLHYHREEIGQ